MKLKHIRADFNYDARDGHREETEITFLIEAPRSQALEIVDDIELVIDAAIKQHRKDAHD